MVRSCLFVLALCWANAVLSQNKIPSAAPKRIGVAFNPNVELLGFVYFLGYEGAQSETNGYPDKRRERYAFGIRLYNEYKSFAGSPNLAVAVSYAENIWLDYFINLIIQLDHFPNAKLTDSLDIRYYRRFSSTGDSLEAKKNATMFLEAMNRLYREVDFGRYLLKSRRLYEHAVKQVENGLPGKAFLPALEAFYQETFDVYRLVPSLTIPAGMGFGANHMSNGKRLTFHIFSSFAPPKWLDSSKIDMGFGDNKHLMELSTHEFGHSFVNPVIDRLPEDVIAKTSHLLNPIRQRMADQGYTSWRACLYEHFVRAGEVLIAGNMGRHADAERLRSYYMKERQFVYLDILLDVLGKYNCSSTGSYEEVVADAMQRLAKL